MSIGVPARVLLSWSSGKDSAWALHVLRQQGLEVVGLLTTFNEAADRVTMHAVRRALVEAQAAAAGLPLWPIPLPWPCANDDYERRMREAIARAGREGVTHLAFGDLFLQDIRDYRIRQLAGTGLQPLFPLWCSAAETPSGVRRERATRPLRASRPGRRSRSALAESNSQSSRPPIDAAAPKKPMVSGTSRTPPGRSSQ